MHLCRNKLNPYDKQETFSGGGIGLPPPETYKRSAINFTPKHPDRYNSSTFPPLRINNTVPPTNRFT